MTEQPTYPQPRHAEPENVSPSAPLRASAETIATLPPPEAPEAQATSSAKVGRIAAGFYLAAAVTAAVALLIAWWESIHMRTFIQATNLMTWTHPRPGSLASVLLATAMMSIAAAMVAMPGILAVNTWLGRRWVRWGAIGGVAVGCAAVTASFPSWIRGFDSRRPLHTEGLVNEQLAGSFIILKACQYAISCPATSRTRPGPCCPVCPQSPSRGPRWRAGRCMLGSLMRIVKSLVNAPDPTQTWS